MQEPEPVEILLVEDNPNDVELTLHALRTSRLANDIKVVRDGEEALNFIMCRGPYSARDITRGPRVILLDLKLPKVDGIEVLRQTKADPRTKMIPIVILTSSTQDKDIVESYQLGVNSYMQKPIDFQQFTESVHQLGLYWLVYNQPPRKD